MKLVKTMWECPPVRAKDGTWYRTFKVVELPRHVAESAVPLVTVMEP